MTFHYLSWTYEKTVYKFILYIIIHIGMLFRTSNTFRGTISLLRGATTRAYISTQMIKKYQQQLQKANPNSLKQYPKTFQQKMVILNDPKTIKLLQVVEFGVKYKKGINWLPLLLISAALAGYLLQKFLPIRVNQRYFMICPQSPTYISGYLFAGFNFGKPFYLYLPAMLGLYQLSRFINVWHLGLLMLVNCIVGDIVSQYLVKKRVSEYEVWQNQRLCFGQGNLLALIFSFWSYIGFTDAFTHLKSRIFLKAVPGAGVIRKGVPFGYICLFYGLIQLIFYQRGIRNSQVVFAEILTGILMGLVLRRIKPILK